MPEHKGKGEGGRWKRWGGASGLEYGISLRIDGTHGPHEIGGGGSKARLFRQMLGKQENRQYPNGV